MRTALQRIDDSIFIRNCPYVSICPGLWRESEQNSLKRTLIRTITLWGKKVCWKSDFCWGTSWGLDQSAWVRGTDWVSMTLNVMSWENRTTTMSGKFQRNIQLLIYFEKCFFENVTFQDGEAVKAQRNHWVEAVQDETCAALTEPSTGQWSTSVGVRRCSSEQICCTNVLTVRHHYYYQEDNH